MGFFRRACQPGKGTACEPCTNTLPSGALTCPDAPWKVASIVCQASMAAPICTVCHAGHALSLVYCRSQLRGGGRPHSQEFVRVELFWHLSKARRPMRGFDGVSRRPRRCCQWAISALPLRGSLQQRDQGSKSPATNAIRPTQARHHNGLVPPPPPPFSAHLTPARVRKIPSFQSDSKCSGPDLQERSGCASSDARLQPYVTGSL